MFLSMSRWVLIWALTSLMLVGAAYGFAPEGDRDYYIRLVCMAVPWFALWASLVAHAPLPSSLRRVHHVTVGGILVLLTTAFAGLLAYETGRLTPLSTRLLLLAGLGAGLFALFGTTWAISASISWQRARRSGVLAAPRPV
jgi:hypothetical protein